ncbi:hypothetical protein [Nostoc sp. DedQUE07]|uniref:hypothetical protein n=1 Tax=Nostoc sp. DedQUE07 TaxID=3075392 RepID=UPI002AD464A5|nr:hypothetical protein [Nostoc sp. DedQUE07]MDZ8131923.1 hypothetical protein [Nostoc sp. DedQUE07]
MTAAVVAIEQLALAKNQGEGDSCCDTKAIAYPQTACVIYFAIYFKVSTEIHGHKDL